MKKTDTLFKQLHDANEKIKNLKLMHNALNEDFNELQTQLDEWIESCLLQADSFFERKMETSEVSSMAMAQAYRNVKQFLNKVTDETK